MFKQLDVGSLVHFTRQNLLSAGNRKSGHFVAQLFAGTLHFLSRFSLGVGNDAVGFDLSLLLGILNDRGTALFAISNDRRGAGASLGLDFLALGLSFGQSFVALVGSGKTFSDLVLAFFDRSDQRRPDVLHRDEASDEEHHYLYKQ